MTCLTRFCQYLTPVSIEGRTSRCSQSPIKPALAELIVRLKQLMINIYLDERIEEHAEKTTFIISSFVLGTANIDDLRETFKKVAQVRKSRRAYELIYFIEKWESLAIITYANIPQDLAKAGEIDATLDIPRMKRRDNIWAQCVLYNLAKICARLSSKVPMDNVRVLFDPKDLPSLLDNAVRNYILTRIPQIAKEVMASSKYDKSSNLNFKQVSFIEKSKSISNATQEQIGISISHHLMVSFSQLINFANLQRISVEDQTSDVIDGLRPFITT